MQRRPRDPARPSPAQPSWIPAGTLSAPIQSIVVFVTEGSVQVGICRSAAQHSTAQHNKHSKQSQCNQTKKGRDKGDTVTQSPTKKKTVLLPQVDSSESQSDDVIT
ncbi:hypothetical protein PMIN03_012509 [Paraphaeosphaeria minitans]